jgi:hypothetical protein
VLPILCVTHVLLIAAADFPHQHFEAVASQLTQGQVVGGKLKVAKLDAAQPAQQHSTATGRVHQAQGVRCVQQDTYAEINNHQDKNTGSNQ